MLLIGLVIYTDPCCWEVMTGKELKNSGVGLFSNNFFEGFWLLMRIFFWKRLGHMNKKGPDLEGDHISTNSDADGVYQSCYYFVHVTFET